MEQDIINGLIARGMPPYIAQAFVMNARDESGFNPQASGDNGNAFGVFQWNGPRMHALQSYAHSNGRDAGDLNTQLDYLMTELQGPESGAWSKIKATGNANDAALAVLNYFERPAEANRARRAADYAGANVNSLAVPQPQQNALAMLPRIQLNYLNPADFMRKV